MVQERQKDGLPPGVEAVEAGGSFFQYWDVLARSKYIITVDTLLAGGPSGTIYLLSVDEITRDKEAGLLRHEDDLLDTLDMLASFGIKPKVIFVGVEPKEITYSLDLSPEISGKIPAIVKIIREQYTLLLLSGNFCLANK